MLAGCFGRSATTSVPAPGPRLTFTAPEGATGIVPTVPVAVRVADGWFQRVALTNKAGKTVAGTLNRDRTAYTVTEPLGYDGTYTWTGSVVGHDGQAGAVNASFQTVSPSQVVNGARGRTGEPRVLGPRYDRACRREALRGGHPRRFR